MNNIETEILPEDVLLENILLYVLSTQFHRRKEDWISVIQVELALILQCFCFQIGHSIIWIQYKQWQMEEEVAMTSEKKVMQ